MMSHHFDSASFASSLSVVRKESAFFLYDFQLWRFCSLLCASCSSQILRSYFVFRYIVMVVGRPSFVARCSSIQSSVMPKTVTTQCIDLFFQRTVTVPSRFSSQKHVLKR